MQKPLVSVIIPTYNRKNLLTETLSSILNQTYKNIEIIVIDNFSNYDFFEHIKSLNDDRILPFQNQNNGIIAVNRNLGLTIAKGEYIAFCDDDDLWLNDKLEKQVGILETHSSIGLCCAAPIFLYSDGTKKNYKSRLFYLKHCFVSLNIIPANYLLVAMNYVINSSVLIRSSTIKKVGYISEMPEWRASEDFDYSFRISQIADIFYIKEQGVIYRWHQNQISTDKGGKKRFLKLLHQYKLNFLQRLILKIREIIFILNIV